MDCYLDEAHGWGRLPAHTPPATPESQRTTLPAEYFIFTRYLCPAGLQPARQYGSGYDVWGGGQPRLPVMAAIPHHLRVRHASRHSPMWRGRLSLRPADGAALLALRAQGEIGEGEIFLPDALQLSAPLPDGLTQTDSGTLNVCGVMLQFFVLGVEEAITGIV